MSDHAAWCARFENTDPYHPDDCPRCTCERRSGGDRRKSTIAAIFANRDGCIHAGTIQRRAILERRGGTALRTRTSGEPSKKIIDMTIPEIIHACIEWMDKGQDAGVVEALDVVLDRLNSAPARVEGDAEPVTVDVFRMFDEDDFRVRLKVGEWVALTSPRQIKQSEAEKTRDIIAAALRTRTSGDDK